MKAGGLYQGVTDDLVRLLKSGERLTVAWDIATLQKTTAWVVLKIKSRSDKDA